MKIKIGLIVGLVVILGYVAASPYIVMNNVKNAIKNGDGDTVVQYIDFPALKENVKEQFTFMLSEQMAQEVNDNPFAALGGMMATSMVDKMVDGYVSPSGVRKLISSKVDESKFESSHLNNADMGYKAWERFEVVIPNDENPEDPVSIVLTRQGIGWKVTGFKLPVNSFGKRNG